MRQNLPRRAALAAGLALIGGQAQAHAILMESAPVLGGQVKAGSITIRLRFNSRIDAVRSGVTLIYPDKAVAPLHVESEGAGDVLAGTATLQPGRYTLRWQVLALDGHITRGDLPFTVVAG